jgi:hypothetical protein
MEQRGKLNAFAEKAGWTIVGQRKETIEAACQDIGTLFYFYGKWNPIALIRVDSWDHEWLTIGFTSGITCTQLLTIAPFLNGVCTMRGWQTCIVPGLNYP